MRSARVRAARQPLADLDLVRAGAAATRPELSRRSGLGRTVIAQRIAELMELGLVGDSALGPSTGGRAPRQLTFRADAGHVLVAELGATAINVALADLCGRLLVQYREGRHLTLWTDAGTPCGRTGTPAAVLSAVVTASDQIFSTL